MSLQCGIIGLPNVGKSTLFNALTRTQAAQSANYPFCTIEPNVGKVAVPDPRLTKIADIAKAQKTIYAQMEFVDIAGLVKGASAGEGLGNQFLGNIRECDAICHVVRCFDDKNITHVAGKTDPIDDCDTIETELMLADLESLERQKQGLVKRVRGNDKHAQKMLELAEQAISILEQGKAARHLPLDDEDKKLLKQLHLITSKRQIYIANIGENDIDTADNNYIQALKNKASDEQTPIVTISAAIEAEIAMLNDDEQQAFLEDLGLQETGLSQVIRAGYDLLQQMSFFTAGEKEARAWTVKRNSTAPQAAGVIHGDFERGFICAETIAYDDYIACNGEQGAREIGKLRQEGRSYIVQEGDIIHFRFNV